MRTDPISGHCPLDGNCRMVRRARSASLDFSGQSLVGKWANQTYAMYADALDFAANDGETPLDYYGATSALTATPICGMIIPHDIILCINLMDSAMHAE